MTNKPPKRVPIYFDAEFTGLHRNTQLISIGMYSPLSGAYLYAEFNDFDDSGLDDWLKEHVIGNLWWNDQQEYSHIHELWNYGEKGHKCPMIKGDSASIKSHILEWLKQESVIYHDRKIQFYADCYAYDWMLLNDLLCEDGKALNLPEFIDYIPMDLSTAMQMADVDPDMNREEFVGPEMLERIKSADPFTSIDGADIKHNSLWDAVIAYACFSKLGEEM